MRQVLCCGIALCVASCTDVKNRAIAKRPLVLPVAPKSRFVGDKASKLPRVTVWLGNDGVVRVDTLTLCLGETELGKALFGKTRVASVSLRQLRGYMAMASRTLEMQCKRSGRNAFEFVHDVRILRIVAVLHIDKDAPARHVQWLVSTLADAAVYRIELAVTRRAGKHYSVEEARELGALRTAQPPSLARLSAALPIVAGEEPDFDFGLEEEEEPDPSHDIFILKKGATIRFRVLDSAPTDLAGLVRLTKEHRPALLKGEVVTLGMDGSIPFKFVVVALDRLFSAGIRRVAWASGELPSKTAYVAPRLP